MIKILLILFLFAMPPKGNNSYAFIIVHDKVSCKDCLAELYRYFEKKKVNEFAVGYYSTQNTFMDNTKEIHIQAELKRKNIPVFVKVPAKYSHTEKHPYLLRIDKNTKDTTLVEYEKLYSGGRLNTSLLRCLVEK